jgi:putative membrane protein
MVAAARQGNMMWWYGAPWWVWHMILGSLSWVAFVILAVIATRRFGGQGRGEKEYHSRDGGILSAMTILQERYARGEIGREEFMQKQHDLAVPS